MHACVYPRCLCAFCVIEIVCTFFGAVRGCMCTKERIRRSKNEAEVRGIEQQMLALTYDVPAIKFLGSPKHQYFLLPPLQLLALFGVVLVLGRLRARPSSKRFEEFVAAPTTALCLGICFSAIVGAYLHASTTSKQCAFKKTVIHNNPIYKTGSVWGRIRGIQEYGEIQVGGLSIRNPGGFPSWYVHALLAMQPNISSRTNSCQPTTLFDNAAYNHRG